MTDPTDPTDPTERKVLLDAIEQCKPSIEQMMKPNTQLVESIERMMKPNTQLVESIERMMKPNTQLVESIERMMKPNTQLVKSIERMMNPSTQLQDAIERMTKRNIGDFIDNKWILPKFDDINRIVSGSSLFGGAVAEYARQHKNDLASQQKLLESITKPWLSTINPAGSTTALIELQGIGASLNSSHVYDDALTKAMRTDFGDWRDRISFTQDLINDHHSRTQLYIQRGFNESLTDFPDDTFNENMVLVGLDTHSEMSIDLSEFDQFEDTTDEAAYIRTNKCHNYLQRLERKLRLFIDEAMTRQYGTDWPKKRLTPQMFESWEFKKGKALSSGMVMEFFIEAADFTDYEQIICRKDHWREVFQSRFHRKESVLESLQRLYPIRLAAMHSRFVTNEDLLYVLAESMRITNAIK